MLKRSNELDRRFTLTLEYAGHARAVQVLRFCGNWLGCFHTAKEAREARRQAIAKHNAALMQEAIQ